MAYQHISRKSGPTIRANPIKRIPAVKQPATLHGELPNAKKLQRRLGNRGTQEWLVQAKLNISHTDDQSQREDRIAKQVTQIPKLVPPKATDERKEERKHGGNLSAPRFAGDPVLEACYNSKHRILTPETGPAVEKVQQALRELGYSLPQHGVDGKFGAETAAAVSQFKRDQGIFPDDGVIGAKTMACLDAIFSAGLGPMPPSPILPIPDFPEKLVVFAGVPVRKDPPGGMSFIGSQSTMALADTAGWTGVPNAAAYIPPRLDTNNIIVPKPNNMKDHYVEVKPTTSKDATLDSYFPGPGNHFKGTYTYKGVTYSYYWRISQSMSDLIRDGEQEHIDDALRAYQITYKLIEDRINLLALSGKRFGPASTPEKAYQMAQAELFKTLPRELQAGYGDWVAMLDLLLKMTAQRDARGWHSLDTSSQEKGNTIYYSLAPSTSTKIKQIPSDQVVNYPSSSPKP